MIWSWHTPVAFYDIKSTGTWTPRITVEMEVAQMVKSLPAVRESWVQSLGWEDPLERKMATHSSIVPRKSYGWRGFTGYSPWGRKELDTTEQLTHTHRWKKDNFLFSQDLGFVAYVLGTMTLFLSGILEPICGAAKMQMKIPQYLEE